MTLNKPPANRTRIFVLLVFLLGIGLFGGQALGQTPTPMPPESDVVKITAKIVQVDLLVVDKDGKQVPDLTAADFEILQDGKPQKISGFSYVNKVPQQQAQSASEPRQKKTDKDAAVPPPIKITPSNAGRVITFIVDDGNCMASTTAMNASREGIEKFLREQMLPNDMVAIYQTRSGSSVFQQYTNDRAQLLKIAHKIQWYPPQGSCASGDGSFWAAARSNTYIKRSMEGVTTATIESDQEQKTREHRDDLTTNNQVVGTLGVIRYVVKGLQRIPGRKVVFFLSDGIPLRARSGEIMSAVETLRDLTDLSNRASVVFNTIDARGLFIGMVEARDEVYVGDDPNASDKIVGNRARDVGSSRDGLRVLASETGGKFYQNMNYLDTPIKRALSIETGYYLIAYEPSEETFKNKKFNKIEVKVKRPDLNVVSRTGFIGVITETDKPKQRSENTPLYEAIVTPLPVPGLDVDLTAYFGNSPETGNFVRSFFHLDGSELKFVDDGGYKKAVVDVVAVTLNEKSEVVDEFTRTHTIRFDPAALPVVRQNGFIYAADVPVKKPGTYNFRVAVRDTGSGMIGSAGQIVSIPDLKKSGLFLSGITVTQVDAQGKYVLPGTSTAASAFSLPATTAVYAIRQFTRGTTLAYAYSIYNARLDKISGRPQVTIQVNLYKDGKMVLEGLPQTAGFENQSDWSRIQDLAYLPLKPDMEPGNYAMELVVKDVLDPKTAVSSQWVDFTVLD